MPDAPRLAVEGLDAGYLGTPVVRELTLDVAAGEVVALLGPNGAGKTTTLSTIAGLLPVLGGTVRLDREPIDGIPAHKLARRGISHVPEDRSLFFGMTVRENLQLAETGGGSLRREQLLELLPELRKCLDRKAGVLSGGEQQMLAVGRALVSAPRVLLVDEMSLGLAPVIVERLLPILRRVADDPAAACCSSSSTCHWRSRWPTGPTSSTTAGSCSRGVRASWPAGATSCGRATWETPPGGRAISNRRRPPPHERRAKESERGAQHEVDPRDGPPGSPPWPSPARWSRPAAAPAAATRPRRRPRRRRPPSSPRRRRARRTCRPRSARPRRPPARR